MVVSGEAWRLFNENHPERDFSDFWFEVSLSFLINSFDLSSFFLPREDFTPTTTASSSQSFLKTEPLCPKISEHYFAYASDIAESGSRDPGHIVELSY
jgi:hypothetical protein